MNSQDIKDVLELQVLFVDHGFDTVGRDAKVLAALIDWKGGNGQAPKPVPDPVAAAPVRAARTPRKYTKRQPAQPVAEPPPEDPSDSDF